MINFAIHVLPLHGYLIPDEKGRGSARGGVGVGSVPASGSEYGIYRLPELDGESLAAGGKSDVWLTQ